LPAPLKNTEAGAIAAIVEQNCHAYRHEFGRLCGPLIVLPKTGEVKSLEHLMEQPRRARAAVTVRDHASFIAYVERHKEPGTVVFAEVKEAGGSFTAIIDYHWPAAGEARETAPGWGEHVCVYACEFTPEWRRWRDLSGKMQDQAALALFVEDNMFDLCDPAPAAMLEIVKTLEATQGAKFKSALRLDNGDRDFAYAQQTEGRAGAQGNLIIPQKFRLKFAVFTNGPAYAIDCRFRWNVDGGALRLGFEIEKPHKVIELALTDAHLAIRETLGVPVLLGSGRVTPA
jgi:uncharacterized protein YfdQ (DUF2303 family)